MNRVALNQIPVESHHFPGSGRLVRRILFALFVVEFLAVWVKLWLPLPWFPKAHWPEGLLVVLATATSVAALTRQLPGQNVIGASLLIAGMGAAAHTLGALYDIPFGPFSFKENFGQTLFHPLPWAIPMIWLVVVLNARGVARLILRPGRKHPAYGLQLIGLTALLAVLFDFNLEPYATSVKEYWAWHATKIPFAWYTAPVVNFFGWGLTALLILAFATPFLLNKKPVKHPPDYFPLYVWLLLNLLFVTGTAVHGLWPAAGVAMVSNLLVGALALFGARA